MVYLVLWLVIPKQSFWGLDNGFKFQGARAFSKTATLDVPYAGLSFDPKGSYRPIVLPFGILHNNQQIPVFSTLFMVSAGVLFWLFGSIGPLMLPLIGGWGCLISVWFLWVRNRGNHDGRAYLLVFGLGSPLLFYSLTLWEHSLSLIPIILAMALIGRRRQELDSVRMWESLVTGALIALATALRTESVLWIPALIISWRWTGRKLEHIFYMIFGFGIVSVMFVVFNELLTDTFLPMHVLTNVDLRQISSITQIFISRLQNFYILMFEGFEQNVFSVLGIIPILLVTFWRTWRIKPRYWWAVFAPLTAVWLIYIANSFGQNNPIGYTSNSGGLLWIAPFAVMGLMVAHGEKRQFWWMIWSSSILFIMLVALASPKVHGVHWGPRFIFQVFPFLLILATATAQKWWKKYPPVRPVVILLLVLSIINQFYSAGILYQARQENANLNKWAFVSGKEATVTDILWLNGDLGLVSDTRPSYYARRQDAIQKVVAGLRSQGYGKFHFFELPPYHDQEFWWWVGAEQMSVDYAIEVGATNRQLRRTTLKIIP